MSFWLRELKHFYYELEDRARNLGIKEWIEWHPRAVMGVAAVSFLLFIVVAIAQLMPNKPASPQEPEKVWFYDLNTKELFLDKNSKLPPIKSPSGPLPDGTPAGVRAYVFSCNNPNGTEPVIGFLEMFSPEGKKSQKSYNPEKHTAEQWARGRFFCCPDDKKWIPADSPEGRAIYEKYFANPNYTELPIESQQLVIKPH